MDPTDCPAQQQALSPALPVETRKASRIADEVPPYKSPFVFDLTFPDGSVRRMSEAEAIAAIEAAHQSGIEIALSAHVLMSADSVCFDKSIS